MKKSFNKSSLIGILFCIILFLQAFPCYGQVEKSDSLTAQQLKDIKNMFVQDRTNASGWWYAWLAGYSAATVGQGIVYFATDNNKTKEDMALGSGTTLLGAIGQLITPIVPRSSSFKSTQIIKSLPEDQYKELDNYEEWLKELADWEKRGRSWKVHAVTGVVNIGSGLITWIGFKRTFWEGVGNFALNTVITETQILTQPIGAIKDYKKYYEKYKSGESLKVLKPEKEWLVIVYAGGFTIRLDF
jgi:hypothetical protein